MPRDIKHEFTLTDPTKLDDLRWLVEQCANLSADSRVTIQGERGNQLDREPAKLVVHGTMNEVHKLEYPPGVR